MNNEIYNRWRWPISIFIILLIITIFCYWASYLFYKSVEIEKAEVRSEFYRTNLEDALERFQNLPYILSKDSYVINGALGKNIDGLNERLADFALQSGLEAIYLMNVSGRTISASNYNDPVTFLGQNYSFRPYFLTALTGDKGEIFAIGTTSSKPGYYVAEPVKNNLGEVMAVIAIKADLNSITEIWNRGGETVLVTNDDLIVVLSTEKHWRYKSLMKLSEAQQNRILSQQQFGQEKVDQLNWKIKDSNIVDLENTTYLFSSVDVKKNDWKLYFLIKNAIATRKAYITSVIVFAILLSLLLWQQFIKSQKVKSALKISQSARKKLHSTNLKLEKEISVRKKTEKHLKQAQKELTQAKHLASLGHVAASATHELGQPVSALKNIITTAEIDPGSESVSSIINRVARITRRMENATEQLRLFSRPGNKKATKISVTDLISGAVELIKSRLVNAKVNMDIQEDAKGQIFIQGNKLKLEQVLVNLLRNACDAVSDKTDGYICVKTGVLNNMAQITVEDNGHGLKGVETKKLFEPFHTTRETGESMGLGLTISSEIVIEHDGRLSAADSKFGGAMFIIELPLWKE